ncbi:MAG: hypothetical protein EOP22_14960 [Hyphomicrobiales bacterium]|nr:MAG: hypothetical protein EOP22_14960 [Hyphomicrobiales bacterium]
MPEKHLTRTRADQHEALYPRLEAMAAQAEAMAARRPGAAVPPGVRVTAETLLYDAQRFLPQRPARGLVVAAREMAGLATQLGQARAALDVFEAAHTAWHPELKCRVWITAGDPLPVRRLRPETSARFKSEKEKRRSTYLREEVIRRMIAKSEMAYEQGYEDAKLDKPMRPSRL